MKITVICPTHRGANELRELAAGRRIVLVCLSGRRARACAERASDMLDDLTMAYLDGGLLQWGAEGLPMVRPDVDAGSSELRLSRLEEFPRVVMSCFVAESIETQLDAGQPDPVDPSEWVTDLFGSALAEEKASAELFSSVLDRLADRARTMGHSLDHIAKNLEAMRSALRSVARR